VKLTEYIKLYYKGSQRTFAQKYNIPEPIISFACNQKPIGRDCMIRIKRATDGQVTLDDLEPAE